MGSFWAKRILFELNKYSRAIFHDNKEWCKIWSEIYLLFQNWHKEFDKFWPEHSSLKSVYLNGFFSTNVWAKKLQRSCLIGLKIDAKFEGKLTCAFKSDLKNLANFYRLKNSDLILESKMVKLNQNQNSKTSRSTRSSVKTFFYLGIKSIGKLTNIFTHVLQNRCF